MGCSALTWENEDIADGEVPRSRISCTESRKKPSLSSHCLMLSLMAGVERGECVGDADGEKAVGRLAYRCSVSLTTFPSAPGMKNGTSSRTWPDILQGVITGDENGLAENGGVLEHDEFCKHQCSVEHSSSCHLACITVEMKIKFAAVACCTRHS